MTSIVHRKRWDARVDGFSGAGFFFRKNWMKSTKAQQDKDWLTEGGIKSQQGEMEKSDKNLRLGLHVAESCSSRCTRAEAQAYEEAV